MRVVSEIDSNWYRFLLRVGNGHQATGNEGFLGLPRRLKLVDSGEEMIHDVYRESTNESNPEGRAILAPINKVCDEINELCLKDSKATRQKLISALAELPKLNLLLQSQSDQST